jgi:integrase/recombinase XerD
MYRQPPAPTGGSTVADPVVVGAELVTVVDPAELLQAPELRAVDRNPAAVYLASLASPDSRVTQRQALDAIASILKPGLKAEGLPWHLLRFQHTQAVRTALVARYAPRTAKRHLSALRGVLKMALRLGLMTPEEHARAVDLKPVPGSRLPKGRCLSPEETRALVQACDPATLLGLRDRAALGILCSGGLRRFELVGLDLEHVVLEHGVPASLRTKGKGNKERLVPLEPGAAGALTHWIRVRGLDPGPLILPFDRWGRIQRRRMSRSNVEPLLEKIAQRAGVAAFAPHDLRRTFISTLLDVGVDIATVQQLAGHASVETTASYDRRGDDVKRRAVQRLRSAFG